MFSKFQVRTDMLLLGHVGGSSQGWGSNHKSIDFWAFSLILTHTQDPLVRGMTLLV